MWDLKVKLRELQKELNALQERRRKILVQLRLQGYSLKKIAGQYYLYTWERENGRARWKCLGNVKKGAGELFRQLEEDRAERIKKLTEELRELEDREREIMQMLGG